MIRRKRSYQAIPCPIRRRQSRPGTHANTPRATGIRCWALPSGQGTYAPGARSDAPHGQDRTVGPHRITRPRETGPETPTMHRSTYLVAPEIIHIQGNEPTVTTPPPQAANSNANRLPDWTTTRTNPQH